MRIPQRIWPHYSQPIQICEPDKNSKCYYRNQGHGTYQELLTNSLTGLNYINRSNIRTSNVQKVNNEMKNHTQGAYQGCLLGGAIGDALGNPVEFMSLYAIKNAYGSNGINDLQLKNGKAEITDDTQMTIFTADGLIKSALKIKDENSVDLDEVYSSYQTWLDTQDFYPDLKSSGWISEIPELYARRAPGNTCIGSLSSKEPGSIEKPINSSSGCGGVMRVAPAGLMYYKNPELAFSIGAKCAALTHGSPDGYLPAGVHASIIAYLIQGQSLTDAVNNSIEILKTYDNSDNLIEKLYQAKTLAKKDYNPENCIRTLGEGWTGDEAIAISVYCALKSPDNFAKGVIMAVNHDGDSDSTGAITGNILGAALGESKIPPDWKNKVEISHHLRKLADDLLQQPKDIENADTRYPINKK